MMKKGWRALGPTELLDAIDDDLVYLEDVRAPTQFLRVIKGTTTNVRIEVDLLNDIEDQAFREWDFNQDRRN